MIGFFDDTKIKYILKEQDGDKLLIVYLRMQLLCLSTEGVIKYDSILPSCNEEIALRLNEDICVVDRTVEILTKLNLVEIMRDGSLFLPEVINATGSETDAAARMREMREKQKENEQNFDAKNLPFTV